MTNTHNKEMNVRDNLGQLATDTKVLLEAVANATEETVIEARNRVKSALTATEESCARVGVKAIEGAKAADKTVRQYPYQAIGIALGIGAVLGFMLSRSHKD